MGRRKTTEVDPAVVCGVLTAVDRRVLISWPETLGIRAQDWDSIAPLRTLAHLVAALTLAGSMQLPRGEALVEAYIALGLERADAELAAASATRSLNRWRAAARARQYVRWGVRGAA